MCENCGPTPPDVQEAYTKFEAAIQALLEAMDRGEGILVDWVLVTSRSVLFEHGDSTLVGWEAGLNQQHYRTKGLMHEVLDNLQSVNIRHQFEDD